MTIKGSCLCGSITFEIDEASGPFEICHCNRCRKVSGPRDMAGVGVKTSHFRMLTGEHLVKSFSAPIIHFPPAFQVHFCSNCGSPVSNPSPEGEWCEIAAGPFDEPLGINTDKHIFVEFVPDWDNIIDTKPQYTMIELYKHRKEMGLL
jgi:hypothetical protein